MFCFSFSLFSRPVLRSPATRRTSSPGSRVCSQCSVSFQGKLILLSSKSLHLKRASVRVEKSLSVLSIGTGAIGSRTTSSRVRSPPIICWKACMYFNLSTLHVLSRITPRMYASLFVLVCSTVRFQCSASRKYPKPSINDTTMGRFIL